MHPGIAARLAPFVFIGFLVPRSAAQEAYPAEYALGIDYDPSSGPRVHRPARDFALFDFRVGDSPLRWELEPVGEPVFPTPMRPNTGTRLTAKAIDAAGEARRFSVTAHADEMTVSVGGLKPDTNYTIRCRVETKTPTVRMRAGTATPFEAPITNIAVGDPEADSDFLYEPAADRCYWGIPTGIAVFGPAAQDGSRWLEWRVRTSPQGEANGLVCLVVYWNNLKTWLLPLEGMNLRKSLGSRAGWRTRPSLGSQVSEKDVLEEARIVRAKLLPFGMTEIEIDDGWQTPPAGDGGIRRGKPDPARFPRGLAPVAAEIRSLGLRPGIEILPQASEADDAAAGIVRGADKTAIDAAPYARHLWDGGDEAGRKAIGEAVGAMARDGFARIALIDQHPVLERYREAERGQTLAFDASKRYRQSLAAAREALGADGYLAFGWCGAPGALIGGYDGFGYCDSFRSLDAEAAGPAEFEKGAFATGRAALANGVQFTSDPGVVFVGEGVTLAEARAWATLAALQGLPFFLGDKPSALTEERLEVLRRTLGILPTRCLYSPSEIRAPRVVHLWREVGGETSLVTAYLSYSVKEPDITVGGEAAAVGAFAEAEKFDFWANRFIGRARVEANAYPISVEPRSCVVIAARKPKPHPMVLSTSRHVSQGALELRGEKWDPATSTLSGTSELVAGDPYEIRIVVPTRAWNAKNAAAEGAPCQISQEGRLVRAAMKAPASGKVAWSVTFAQDGDAKGKAVPVITGLRAIPGPGISVRLDWNGKLCPSGSFAVKRDGRILGLSSTPNYLDRGADLTFGERYSYEVVPFDDEGVEAPAASLEYQFDQPARLSLLAFDRHAKRAASNPLAENVSALGTPLKVGGKIHKIGFGANTPLMIDLPLRGARGTVVMGCAIDDGAEGKGAAQLMLLVDGKPIGQSPIFRAGAKPADVRMRLPAGKVLTIQLDHIADAGGVDTAVVDLLDPVILATR